MDYGKLISQSTALAWRHKILWIFGLFTGVGSSAFHHELPSDGDFSDFGRFGEFGQRFQDFDMDVDPEVLLPLIGGLIAVGMIIWLIFLIANLICTPALIDSVNNITRGGQFGFSRSFSRGVDYFWKFLGLFIIQLFAGIGTAIICIPLGILLIITIIGIPVAIALIFFVIYFWFTIFSLAERAVVVRDCSVTEGLSEGWQLLKENFGRTMMMALIYFCLSIAIAIAAFIIWIMIAFPAGSLFGIGTGSVLVGILTGIVVSLPIWIIIGGFSGTIFSTFYTMFYFELVQPGSMTSSQISPPDDPSGPLPAPIPDGPTPPADPPPAPDPKPPVQRPPEQPPE